jgi:hypothetical protein
MLKSLSLILFLAIAAMPGCSHFSRSARDERAYAKFVRKSANAREKQQKKFLGEKTKVPPVTLSGWQVNVETSAGPQAVPSDSSNQ